MTAHHPKPTTAPTPGASALYRCRIKHQRTAPLRYGFTYRTHLWLVDLDDPPRLPGALGLLAGFRSADHLGPGSWRANGSGRLGRTAGSASGTCGRPDAASGEAPPTETAGDDTARDGGPAEIKADLIRWCAQQGVDVSGCRILMLTAARSLGYVFNPLTVFWCLGPDGAARHVIAEVHNTYGARHCYLFVPRDDGPTPIDKQFYVSPFFAVDGGYRMTVPTPADRLHVAITLTLPDGSTPFVATVRGDRQPPGTAQILRTLARDPFASYRVPLGIRYHAIKMLLRGLRIQPGHRGPVAPAPPTPAETATPAPEPVPAAGGARHGRHQ
ncbi:MAG TPA: DUF1365 domain-containing protein [Actinocrinis sp.]|nr:DUF1365 domain-containing protein [Actinocrinis sp.]